MKEFLSRAGHTFTERSVDDDLDAYHDLLALGLRTVPVTVIDGRIIRGYDAEALTTALAGGG